MPTPTRQEILDILADMRATELKWLTDSADKLYAFMQGRGE